MTENPDQSSESVSEFFEHDHARLDECFEDYRRLKNEDFEEARESFLRFYEGLLKHIEWEDEVLFPAFEEKMGEGLTGTMRVEHEQIKDALEVLHEKVSDDQIPSERDDERLLKYLEPHNNSEETVLYPAIDRHLDEETLREVFSAIDH